MHTILITGATGNVGIEVIKALQSAGGDFRVLAGVRSPEKSRAELSRFNFTPVRFDFEDLASADTAFAESDVLFLLRPPQISDVGKYFAPLIQKAVEHGVGHIVFLSVQGVESSSIIPHHKIEKLITESGIPYTFLRPAYFMQNFTTTLRTDLTKNDKIYLPAGNAKFTVIDVADVGRVAAKVLINTSAHIDAAYDLTNDETLTFGEMAEILTDTLGRKITFNSPNLISFYLQKRREGVAPAFIFVMIMLHYLPRFQKNPPTSYWVEKLTKRAPTTFRDFAERNNSLL
ncbi:MAG: NmrA family NAD(P)-binding protein [Cryomorphaceae bacterium]|nr:NmrA family NAD(P)-binding protein [Flavobacteriales bacterium]